MSKISSNNNEIISMIDKTKTPVFNINICDKFIEFSGGKEISEIPENKDNISAANKSSNRDKSFNEDNEEFDDIPLCDYKPKNNQYENKIPKLNIHENNNQDENNKIFEEKKEKPKVSFNAKFDFKKKIFQNLKNLPLKRVNLTIKYRMILLMKIMSHLMMFRCVIIYRKTISMKIKYQN